MKQSQSYLTLTSVVFELSIGNLFLVLLVNLTLTSVVFELYLARLGSTRFSYLTLTSVVFEFNKWRQINHDKNI